MLMVFFVYSRLFKSAKGTPKVITETHISDRCGASYHLRERSYEHRSDARPRHDSVKAISYPLEGSLAVVSATDSNGHEVGHTMELLDGNCPNEVPGSR